MILLVAKGLHRKLDKTSFLLGNYKINTDENYCHPDNKEATVLCEVIDGELHHLFTMQSKGDFVFFTTGIINCVRPSTRPDYCKIELIQERLGINGDTFTTETIELLMKTDEDEYKKLRKLMYGDAITVAGTAMKGKDGRYYYLAQIIDSVNAFSCIGHLEKHLPFQDLKKHFELKEEDF